MLQVDYHQPVLLNEAVDFLITTRDGIYFDGTLGGGGYSLAVLKRISDKGFVIATDLDKNAIDHCSNLFKEENRIRIYNRNFKEFQAILMENNIDKIDGAVLDLGVSSYQLDNQDSGFTYKVNTEFDLRFDKNIGISAYEVIKNYSVKEISEIISNYGEEKNAKKIAFLLKEASENKKIHTQDVVEIVSKITRKDKVNETLSRVFQAFRIFVNDELENLKVFLNSAIDYVKSGGRIVVVSYHSLEDRIVKEFFNYHSLSCVCPKDAPVCNCGKVVRIKKLHKKVITASSEEIGKNVRSRSAKLRAGEVI